MTRIETTEIDLSKLSSLKQFASFFTSGDIEKMARQSGFITRSSSRLTGEAFLKMMVANIAPPTEWSLNDQCDYLQEHFGIEMTKQALDERYHTFTVAFLKQCYQAILRQSFTSETTGLASSFPAIYLTDATSFQLPPHLAAFYQSNGGSTSGSCVKIHQTVELLKFRIADFLITDGKENDGNYFKKKSVELLPGSLWIADLGYFSWKTLTQIAGSGSYFLSRYKTATSLYVKDKDEKYVELNIEDYLRRQSAGGQAAQSLTVYFGQEKIAGRLISAAVPLQVKEQRLSKYRQSHANQSKQGKQWEMTAVKEWLCGYNLYITNATEAQLGTEAVMLIYSLRWQIELLFKIWKSLLFIDQVPKMSIFRFESFLYGRLIFILLSTELMAYIKDYIEEKALEIEISEWKTMKLIKKNYTL